MAQGEKPRGNISCLPGLEGAEGKASAGSLLRPLALSELFLWGVVTRPHGLRGEVRVRVFAQNPTAYPLKVFWIARREDAMTRPERVVGAFPVSLRHPGDPKAETFWRVRLAGIEDREAAERLRGAYLYLSRTYLPSLPPGHFYYFEAEGAQVVDAQEGYKGRLKEIVPGPAHDFFVVQGVEGELYWIPAPFVVRLDKQTQPPTLWIEAPSGLWDPTLAQGRP